MGSRHGTAAVIAGDLAGVGPSHKYLEKYIEQVAAWSEMRGQVGTARPDCAAERTYILESKDDTDAIQALGSITKSRRVGDVADGAIRKSRGSLCTARKWPDADKFFDKGTEAGRGRSKPSPPLLRFEKQKKTYSTVARAVAVGRHSAFRLLSAFSSGSLDAAVVLAARTVHLVKRPKGEGVGKDRERR